MKMIKKLILKYKELIIYVLFGGLTTVVNLGVYTAFDRLLGEDKYLITNIIAWFAAVSFSYITSKIWVFESKSWSGKVLLKEVSSFFAARILTLGIEELGLFVLVDLLDFNRFSFSIFSFRIGGGLIAKAAVAVVVVLVNYLFSKLVIFRKKKK